MKIGFVGAGKMAEAIMSLLLESEVCDAAQVYASDISDARRDALAAQYGINVTSDNNVVVDASEIVVLAVKPQELDVVLADIGPSTPGKLFISIAAGKTLAYFASKLPSARVVRVMPNLACQVGEGMSAYCGGSRATAEDLVVVDLILRQVGRALQIDESLFDVVTALSGSGPAFFAYALKAMVEGAVSEGMDHDAALVFAEQTMLGSAKVLMERDVLPAEFIEQVASTGGTTAAGLVVLEEGAVGRKLQATIAAATERSRELSA